MSERARTLLRTVGPWQTGVGVCLVLALVLGAFLRFGAVPPQQQAVGQEATEETTAPPAPADQYEPPAPDLTPALDQYLAEEERAGIPGLSVMDVVGRLGEAPPDANLSCTGPSPDGGVYAWRCEGSSASPTDEGVRAEYRVEVIGEDPRTILSVTASANRATDPQAAEFLAHVGGLAVEDTSPLDAQVWVRANVASGGSTFSDGAGLELYGYEGARVLELVATG